MHALYRVMIVLLTAAALQLGLVSAAGAAGPAPTDSPALTQQTWVNEDAIWVGQWASQVTVYAYVGPGSHQVWVGVAGRGVFYSAAQTCGGACYMQFTVYISGGGQTDWAGLNGESWGDAYGVSWS